MGFLAAMQKKRIKASPNIIVTWKDAAQPPSALSSATGAVSTFVHSVLELVIHILFFL